MRTTPVRVFNFWIFLVLVGVFVGFKKIINFRSKVSVIPGSYGTKVTRIENAITESFIELDISKGQVQPILEYLQCRSSLGHKYSKPEILLLHGAAFKKENWKESGIIQSLCNDNNSETSRFSSILALDLTVKATGMQFKLVIDSLVESGILSGRPLIVISPSASGKAVLGLSSNVDVPLDSIFHAWVPVACGAILHANEDVLQKFTRENIPIFGIYGSKDEMGARVSDRLVNLAAAEKKMINGGHPCYLDSPHDFVQALIGFGNRRSLW